MRCSSLEAALSHERFIAAYVAAKRYACCAFLGFLSRLWLGLLLVGGVGLLLSLAAMVWVGRMDRLAPKGWVDVSSSCKRNLGRARWVRLSSTERVAGGSVWCTTNSGLWWQGSACDSALAEGVYKLFLLCFALLCCFALCNPLPLNL
jgi:hypothetical protein